MQQPDEARVKAQPIDNPNVSQTRSFSTVFLIEMWERFGYYGMQALIVYYMVQRLGFTDTRANLTWGAGAALIYVSPAIGGWVGDKILGTRHTMLFGAIVLAFGYALMVVPGQGAPFLFFALGVIVVGNGLFKANAGNLVRKIYEGDDAKIDSAFTLYYMAVNIGSMISILLTPWIKDYVNAAYGNGFGWHAAFGVCSVGLLVGLANWAVMRHTLSHIGSEPDRQPLNFTKLGLVFVGGIAVAGISAVILNYELVARIFVYAAAASVLGIFAWLISKSESHERAGLIVTLVLTLETVLFFIFYQQMSTSLSLFALRNVEWDQYLFGVQLFSWKPAQFQALNPIWIFILSPILAVLYNSAARRNKDLSIASKFAIGFVVVAVGFFIYGLAGQFAENGRVSSWVMIAGYGFQSLGELLVSGLGLAFVARYVPARMGGFMMGAYFVATGVSQYLGGLVATMASVPNLIRDYSDKLGATGLQALADLPPTLLGTVRDMDLDAYRQWLQGTQLPEGVTTQFSQLPAATQQSLEPLNHALYNTTLPIYTDLFNTLGYTALGCIVIAVAVLPFLRKLSASHQEAGAGS
ncbi:MAG TPA: oligopeptide:H+ symporter [Gammaproteobacteria bacterium]|nr:oligopeptide:H+ symporter [Gammaproteobacteria bacterium]